MAGNGRSRKSNGKGAARPAVLDLTDNEKRDIMEHLQADKLLQDKYRFLLFGDKREVEPVWNGKTNEVCNVVLPFHTIEQVDEPRAERSGQTTSQFGLFSTDKRSRQLADWTNKLIWSNNKLILPSLKGGSLREEIEKQGGSKFIYIDPPFDVSADFSMDIEIGGDTFTKKPIQEQKRNHPRTRIRHRQDERGIDRRLCIRK